MRYEDTKHKKKVIYTDIQGIKNNIALVEKRATQIKNNKIYIPINRNKKILTFSSESVLSFNKFDGRYFKEWKIDIGNIPINILPYIQHAIVISNVPSSLIIDTVGHNFVFEQVENRYNLVTGIVITEENSDYITYDEIDYRGGLETAYINFGLIATLYLSIYNPF